jgi:hypothetical protein
VNENNLEERVTSALRNKSEWEQLVVSEDDAVAVLAVLQRLDLKLAAEFTTRRSAMAVTHLGRQSGEVDSATYKRTLREYTEWKRKATFFRGVVRDRMFELQDRGKTARDRAKGRAAYAAALRLAAAIYQHSHGDLTDTELYETLGEVKLSFGLHGVISLREAIEDGHLDSVLPAVAVP